MGQNQAGKRRVIAAVSRLAREYQLTAAGVLASAFYPDPLMQWLFYDAILRYEDCLAALFHFSCEVRLALGWPLLGAWTAAGELAGVAGLDLPGTPEWPPPLDEEYLVLGQKLGRSAMRRLEHFSALADAGRPDKVHLKVGMIGVAPQFRGHGYGRALMAYAYELAHATPGVEGIWLDTENPRNLAWYRGLGYQVIATGQAEDVTVWGMYLPLTPGIETSV